MRTLLKFAIPLVLLGSALPARAQVDPALPDWDHLSTAQRELIVAPTRERWNTSPDDRPRMLHHAERWRAMTPQQRAQARHGLDRFQTMTPEQREQARAAFEQFRGMAPQDRHALRQKLRAMTPEQRDAWLKSHAGAGAPPNR